MGQRGPAPEPRALREIKGTAKGANREPKPAGEVLEPEMRAPAAAVWRRLAPDLKAKDVLTAWDVDSFAAYCEAVASADEALEHLETEGRVILHPKQGVCRNPWWQIWRESIDVMVRLGSRFGLTPSDRGALKVGDDGDGKPGEDLLTG
jgi:P27 family predicted phage terminase small subunit